ncbi:sulfotransferase family protein [Thiorhodovibrio frisius]|uniref:Sulfotransferase family protein n=1 Tax=Thiorhodovibrio frisius TaxID=631362 RepID=H8YYC9_9GAMM|nr:sulfotransferase [Thiorhodovibrio frisius]EIC23455.1 sulfotransferase family protein [Thiorhodovibrio frisius]WPL23462.1 Sulfotransferase domain protein [Thiorhodovibrio frisius]
MTKPVFIFSLPRSGSTLAQRILTRSSAVASASEPWLLLPFLYTLRERGQFSEYWHGRTVEAVQDFCEILPGGEAAYRVELAGFVRRLYGRAAGKEAIYFLDKTPRYHLVAEEIVEMFADGKFIFLWRHPLAVAASIMETWGGGRWKLHAYKIDLYTGLENLVDCYELHANRALSIRYEDMVSEPEATFRSIMEYLELPFEEEMVDSFPEVKLSGRMGDPTGTRQYFALSDEPLSKWKKGFCNPVRKQWARSYLRWLGTERLSTMGYDHDSIMAELDAIPQQMKNLGWDVLLRTYGIVYCLFEPAIVAYKLRTAKRWFRVHSHR